MVGLLQFAGQAAIAGGASDAAAGIGAADQATAGATHGSHASASDADPLVLHGSGESDPDEVEGIESGEEEENDPSDWARSAEPCLHLPNPAGRRASSSAQGVVAAGSRRVASARAPPVAAQV